MCIIMKGTKAGGWKCTRSVEILGYHQDNEQININVTLMLDNLLQDGASNFLDILHPGNIEFRLVNPWPLFQHPDTKRERGLEDIASIYSKSFNYIGGKLTQINELSSWDSWFSIPPNNVTIWPKEEMIAGQTIDRFYNLVYPNNPSNEFIPFSTFRIGPFKTSGAVLSSFNISIKDITYREIISRRNTFTIDGPMPMLSKIKFDYIDRLPKSERTKWNKEIDSFNNIINPIEGYDIVILGKYFADEIFVKNNSWISSAPLDIDSSSIGNRFITSSPYFSMSMQYKNDSPIMDKHDEPRYNAVHI